MVPELPRTAQEYLFDDLGGDTLRSHYTEWAAHNAARFDYIRADQLAFAQNTYRGFAEFLPEGQEKPYAIELRHVDANGSFSPEERYRPKAWGYNVIRITNASAATYTFALAGVPIGSAGSDAHFEAQVVLRSADGTDRFEAFSMNDAVTGSVTVSAGAADTEVLVVVAAVPQVFEGEQSFDYALDIRRN